MNARFLLTTLATAVMLLGFSAAGLHAQFGGLDRLKQGLDKAKGAAQTVTETSQKVADTAKDAGKIAKGVMGIGPDEERLIGESVALEIVGKYGGLVRDEAITKRINLLGQALAFYSARPVLPWQFAVLDSPTINGFSAPGGFVFITRGLYEKVADSDDALAAILAHEISHITQRHALKIIARTEFVSGTSSLALKNSTTAQQLQSQLAQFDTGISELLKAVLEKGFDPKTELMADKAGQGLAVTVGYAPGSLRQVLVQLQLGKSEPKEIFPTHPSLSERIKNLMNDSAQKHN